MQIKLKKYMSLLLALIFFVAMSSTVSATLDRADNVVVGGSTVTDSAGNGAQSSATTSSAAKITYQVTPSEKQKFTTFQSWISQLKTENSDVVGWLMIPGTNINTVIVQSPTERNNVYYNSRDWKKNNFPGLTYKNYVITSTFLDYRVVRGSSNWRSNSRNTVIYGHNWTNLRNPYDIGNVKGHDMLAQMPSYTDVKFAKENPYIYYSTGEIEGIWKVFAAATCEVDRSFFYNSPNPSKESLNTLIKEWKQRSNLTFDVDVSPDDRILTISTCTREYPGVEEKQRFVVVARLLREGETDKDSVSVTVNKNKKIPTFPK